MNIEGSPNGARTDLLRFNEARRAFPALLKTLDEHARQQGWSIHDSNYGPFRAVCAAILKINRMHKTLRYCRNQDEIRATIGQLRDTYHHLTELIQQAQSLTLPDSNLHHEIINQALIVQREFPPDVLGGR